MLLYRQLMWYETRSSTYLQQHILVFSSWSLSAKLLHLFLVLHCILSTMYLYNGFFFRTQIRLELQAEVKQHEAKKIHWISNFPDYWNGTIMVHRLLSRRNWTQILRDRISRRDASITKDATIGVHRIAYFKEIFQEHTMLWQSLTTPYLSSFSDHGLQGIKMSFRVFCCLMLYWTTCCIVLKIYIEHTQTKIQKDFCKIRRMWKWESWPRFSDPVYTWAKWNLSKIGTSGPCVYTRTVGTGPFGTAIRAILAPLKDRFHLVLV